MLVTGVRFTDENARHADSCIYKYVYAMGTVPMPISSPLSRTKEAKLFRNNRSQAVRIPVEFELPGDRVLIHREEDKLIIEPITRPTN